MTIKSPHIGLKQLRPTAGIQMPMAAPQQAPDPLGLIIDTLLRFNEKKLARDLIRAFYNNATILEQLDHIARLAMIVKDYQTSISACLVVLDMLTKQITFNPDAIYAARSNLINVLAHANHPIKALEYIRVQESIRPIDQDRDLKKAYCLFLSLRRDEAETILNSILNDPTIDNKTRREIEFNLGTYDLWNGRFKSGIRRFMKYGSEFNTWDRPALTHIHEWNGNIQVGRIVIVIAEAGIGDEFINIRFAKQIMDSGMHVAWVTNRTDLHSVFSRSIGCQMYSTLAECLVDHSNNVAGYCYSMNLPILLDLDVSDLWTGPYITPDPEYVKLHRDDIIRTDEVVESPIIGVRWSGNADYDQDNHRTIPYDQIVNACNTFINGRIYSLQKDSGVEYIDERVVDLSNKLNTWEDTIAIISLLDIVVTSCTAIAHIAGAMGVPTIVLPPISAYYTWCYDGTKSPWYGESTIVLHQQVPEDWKPSLDLVKKYTLQLLMK